jgi:acyl-CoA thioesterase
MNNFGKLTSTELVELKKGYCSYKLIIKKEHLATEKVIHGGMLSAMMDTIMGVACLTQVEDQQKLVATLEFKITYFNPAYLNDVLIGEGEVIKAGNRIIYAEGVIKNNHGKIICKGSGTFNAYPAIKVGVQI